MGRTKDKTKPSRTVRVSNFEEILAQESAILRSVEESFKSFKTLIGKKGALDFLHDVKFTAIAFDPMAYARPLNFIEHANQTFTCFVTLKAASIILKRHPTAVPLTLQLGATGGVDILSEDCSVAAEAFAATSPSSNRKLDKDILGLRNLEAQHKYVFFYCPGHESSEYVKDGVCIVPLKTYRVLPPLPTKDMECR